MFLTLARRHWIEDGLLWSFGQSGLGFACFGLLIDTILNKLKQGNEAGLKALMLGSYGATMFTAVALIVSLTVVMIKMRPKIAVRRL